MYRTLFTLFLVSLPALAQTGTRQSYDLLVSARGIAWYQDDPLVPGSPVDAVVATDDYLRLLKGQTDGSFVVTRDTSTSGPDVLAVEEVDLQANGIRNIFVVVVANPAGGGTIEGIAREGPLGSVGILTIGNTGSWVTASADAFTWNGDIYQDVAVVAGNEVIVGAGSFLGLVSGTTLTLPADGRRIAAGDVDGDGFDELFVTIPSLKEIVIIDNVSSL